MQWYYSKNGTQLGPVGEHDLRSKLASGEISQTDLVWRDGMADWLPAAKVPELAVVSAAVVPPVTSAGGFPPTPQSPYQPPSGTPLHPHIPNYLWQSIVVTIFCCWPLGIPAIVFAAKVDGLIARGDLAGAAEASKNAKMWSSIAAGIGLVVIIGYILLMVIGGIAQS